MTHSFNTEIATLYGVNAAVIFQNFVYWTAQNEANGRFFSDGTYWVPNSAAALAKLFPYLTVNQIRYALEKLITAGLIIANRSAEKKFDKSLWHALTDEGRKLAGLPPLKEEMNDPSENGRNGEENENDSQKSPETPITTDVGKFSHRYENIPTSMSENSELYSNNNINNIYTQDIEEDIEKESVKEKPSAPPPPPPRQEKHCYGEYSHVLLTDEEFKRLHEKHPNADEAIVFLDEYIEYKGYKAKSHYLALRKWVFDALKERDIRRSRLERGISSGSPAPASAAPSFGDYLRAEIAKERMMHGEQT